MKKRYGYFLLFITCSFFAMSSGGIGDEEQCLLGHQRSNGRPRLDSVSLDSEDENVPTFHMFQSKQVSNNPEAVAWSIISNLCDRADMFPDDVDGSLDDTVQQRIKKELMKNTQLCTTLAEYLADEKRENKHYDALMAQMQVEAIHKEFRQRDYRHKMRMIGCGSLVFLASLLSSAATFGAMYSLQESM